MNWYKKSIYDEFDWDFISNELEEKFGRKPTADEIQEEMMRRAFDDSFKKEPVLV